MKPLSAVFAVLLTASLAVAEPVQVELTTSMGPIVIELDKDRAPKTVENFLGYVQSGFYDGTVFHRVIPDFMIQGGGMNADLTKKETRGPIENEGGNGLKNKEYTVAMARTGDPDSATAQFFINTKDNDFLDRSPGNPGYAVFGRVVQGFDVVDQIEAVETGQAPNPDFPPQPYSDVPTETVTIEKASVLEPAEVVESN